MKLNVLICDDDPDILSSLKALIDLESGYEVILSETFESALSVAKNVKIDIALLDIKIGADNGLDLILPIRKTNPDITILMMTAYRDEKYSVEAIRLGVNDYLPKPFNPADLLHGLQRLQEKIKLQKDVREAELALKNLNESLEEKVKEKTYDLENMVAQLKKNEALLLKAKKQAESASVAKSSFLSAMSHQFRTPLNAILGFAQLLEVDSSPALSECQIDNVKEILFSGRQLLTLVDDVLFFADNYSNEIDVMMDDVLVSEVIVDCLELRRESIEQLSLSLVNNVSDMPYRVKANKDLLNKVINNLLSNAIKFNLESGNISIDGAVSHKKLRVSITNTGQGIPKERSEKIFLPFQTSERQSIFHGVGIGLVIVKMLVEAMLGEVGVESKVGETTTFWFELPMADNV